MAEGFFNLSYPHNHQFIRDIMKLQIVVWKKLTKK